MTQRHDTKAVFDELLDLYKNYSRIHRRNLSYDKYVTLRDNGYLESSEIALDDPLLSESLLEHIGNLPVVASFLYPYLEHRDEVDLGRVLAMLSIHDIGETRVGDEHPHKKSQEYTKAEYQAARELLPEEFHALLDEYKRKETIDAKYAKSADVFSTFLSDQLQPPEMVRTRLKMHGFSWREEYRYDVFKWDTFLEELFKEVVRRYQKIEGASEEK